ncbi:MAG: SDR family oxidoreductase [Mycobacterium sp.]
MSDTIGGKVALILGAAGGIGAACARVLASRGALLALADIDDGKLSPVVDSVADSAAQVSRHHVDITDYGQVAATVDAVVDVFGRIDVLINCAGVMYLRPVVEVNVAEWNTMVELNLKGTMWAVAAALPVFLRLGGGHIVSLGSVHGRKVSPGSAAHSASKFGVNAFAEGLRAELAPYAIRVTTVNPGAVDTGMQNKSTGIERGRLDEIYRSAMPVDIIARAIAFAIEQPGETSINEIVVRSTSQRI